jgi:hypothetical protein
MSGVIFGATGRRHSDFQVPKLKEIYEQAVRFGVANADSPYIAAILQAKQRNSPQRSTQRPDDRLRDRRFGRSGPSRFDQPRPPRRYLGPG